MGYKITDKAKESPIAVPLPGSKEYVALVENTASMRLQIAQHAAQNNRPHGRQNRPESQSDFTAKPSRTNTRS